eukprot:2977606-Amphidinium_carterae.1
MATLCENMDWGHSGRIPGVVLTDIASIAKSDTTRSFVAARSPSLQTPLWPAPHQSGWQHHTLLGVRVGH